MRRWPGLKSCFSVECESSGEMSVLELQHSNLTCVPTDIFKAEPNLEEVYLDANQIRELPRVSIYCSVLILKKVFSPGQRRSICQMCESWSIFFFPRFALRRYLVCRVCTSLVWATTNWLFCRQLWLTSQICEKLTLARTVGAEILLFWNLTVSSYRF